MSEKVTQAMINEWLRRLKALQPALTGSKEIAESSIQLIDPSGMYYHDLSKTLEGLSFAVKYAIRIEVRGIHDAFRSWRRCVFLGKPSSELSLLAQDASITKETIASLRKKVIQVRGPQIDHNPDSPLYGKICLQVGFVVNETEFSQPFLVPVEEIEDIVLIH